MTTLAFALAYLGMLALCMAKTRHYREMFNAAPTPGRQRNLQLSAFGLLLGTAVLDSTALGSSIGLIVCFGQVMFAGLSVGLMLAWQKRWVLPLGGVLGFIGVLTSVGGG